MSATIELERHTYTPGETLRGRVSLAPLPGEDDRTVELSVLWQTEGKGDTDLGVILHRILAANDPRAARASHAFEVAVPPLPLSYEGHLVKVRWLVRVRRLATFSSDAVFEAPFVVAWPA